MPMSVLHAPPSGILAEHVFTLDDQQRFGQFSGDLNPIHLDAIAARRTPAGTLVVHGMHQVLWALEELREILPLSVHVVALEARFAQFLFAGEPARLSVVKSNEDSLRLSISAQGTLTAHITVRLGPPSNTVPDDEHGEAGVVRQADNPCRNVRFEDLNGLSDELPPWSSSRQAIAYFPGASTLIGSGRVNAIAAVSRLVGMRCPGLHSVMSAVQLEFVRPEQKSKLHFRVSRANKRFSHVTFEVGGLGVQGIVQAFMRQPPVAQETLDEIKARVRPGEFAGAIALIVGASRGLGQVVARLIAAGGGRVIATYCVGRNECEQLAAEIRESGGICDVLSYDGLQPAAGQLSSLVELPTSLYYFATARIYERPGGLYEAGRFHDFTRMYVDGFYDLCTSLHRDNRALTAVYPSTIYVEARPAHMTTYAMAKAAGEILCQDLSQFCPGLRVYAPRLPRLATDQTASITASGEEFPSAAEALLPIVRQAEQGTPAS